MWWGISPPLDLQEEIKKTDSNDLLEFLIVGESDARHVIKTISSLYKHPRRKLKFHIIEATIEQINRSILFLSTCLETNLGLQEATCYYLDILGNTLLRSATAKFLIQRAKKLSQIPTKNIQCPWLNLEFLRHRDKDQIESIFRFWRENGIAFTWIEGEPSRSNPTLISNIIPEGKGFLHFAYLGDIKNGPFFTWALNEDYTNKKLRSTDVAEKEVMRSIYEIREKAPMCEEIFSAHRDSTILTGTIVTEMPSNEIEQESWSNDKFKIETINLEWIAIPEIEIIFHPIEKLNRFMEKEEFHEKFSLIFLAHNMTKQISNLVPLLKRNCPFIVESRKFLIELKNENLTEFSAELQNIANENGLRNVNNFDSQKQMFARFLKT
ncbi:dynein axonemal assembly factor 3 isoform X3 [Leptopilina boulardi]|uniref:dynein axonemal assembly factor 3 isoform X3 n=1 Tax=Leptopilina boulardi TaxID=63433 RepID=UPI0021F5C5F2|nr:dynein axonemal assembly factor 3 isoform X3 [Leptopilina boulardi]